jgi:hypothetical protein
VTEVSGAGFESVLDFTAAGLPAPWPAPAEAYHEMLLRLAGHAPDELLTRCRTWLAHGRRPDIGRALAHAALAWGMRMGESDIELLAGLLREAEADPTALALVAPAEPIGPAHGFAPTLELALDCLQGRADPSAFWPGDGGPQAARPHDRVCEAAIQSATATEQARALWRAWRFPADGSPWPDPRRVYLVETDQDADLAAVTDAVQETLRAAGEDEPQVETYPVGAVLPQYQRRARAFGALLWSRIPDPGVRIAELFPDEGIEEGEGDEGAGIEDRPRLDEAERAQLSAYLWAGEILLESHEPEPDPLDPEAFESVPMSVRTDGFWVWSDAVTLCLDRHGLSPHGHLVRQARSRGYLPPMVEGAAVYRALAALRVPYPDSPGPNHPDFDYLDPDYLDPDSPGPDSPGYRV